MKTLHAPFSFSRGSHPGVPGYVRPLSLSRALIPSPLAAGSSAPGRNALAVGWGPSRRLPRRRATAAGSYRMRRKPYLHSGSTTKLDAAARPVRCHPYDRALLQRDDRRYDFDLVFFPAACPRGSILEHPVYSCRQSG